MIRHMADENGAMGEIVDGLAAEQVVDETPHGRLAGMDQDTGLVIREMYQLLTGLLTAVSPAVYAQALQDLAGQLVDLHKRTEHAYEEIMEAKL